MQKAHQNINWENKPSIETPINETNLNLMDRSIDEIDNRVIAMDTSKAEQSDLLQACKAPTFDSATGTLSFPLFNGSTVTINTNLEKMPVNFVYDSNPSSPHYQSLVLTLDDGTVEYIDLSALLTQYEFNNSSTISWTVGTDGSITANIIDGSITDSKIQPNYLADITVQASRAESSEIGSNASALVSEGWARGTQNGVPVTSGSVYYHNNAEWYKDQAQQISAGTLAGLNDVTIDTPTQGQTLLYDERTEEWVNGEASAGILPKLHIVTESNSSVTVTKGTETFTPTLIEAGIYEMDAPEYGTYTVRATNTSGVQTVDVVVDTCKIYNVTVYHFNATITVTYPAGAVCTITKDGVSRTADTNPMAFGVNEVGTYTIAITEDGQTVSQNVTITTDGQTESLTLDFAYIELTIPSELIGQTVTITDGTSTRTWVADTTTHTFVCILGTYTLSTGLYNTTVNVVAYTTYTAQFVPDGSTITPTDDVQTLLNCADIWDKTTYTTIADLIADDTSLLTVLTGDNAIDYLVRSTTFASAITTDSDAMAMIGSYDYASDTLLGNSTWVLAIGGSTYKASVINCSVPKMTSNNTPNGVASGDYAYDSSHTYYNAFDKNVSTNWSAYPQPAPHWIRYEFPEAVRIVGAMVNPLYDTGLRIKAFKIQGSNDGFVSDTHDLYSNEMPNDSTYQRENYYWFVNSTAYKYIQLYCSDMYTGGYITIRELDFYGRENGGVQSWLKAGGITDKDYTTLAEVLADTTTLSALIASHDAVDYLVTAKAFIDEIVADATAMSYIGLNNYCANTLLSDSAWCLAIVQSSYKELVLNVKVPAMTSDTTPSGQVIYSSYYDTRYYAWQTFNGNLESNGWVPSSSASFNDAYVGYIFVDPVSVKAIMLYTYVTGAYHVSSTFKLQGSNDGVNWTDLSDNLVVTDYKTVCNFVINNANTYSQYRLRYLASSTGDITHGNGLHAQFYGREDV